MNKTVVFTLQEDLYRRMTQYLHSGAYAKRSHLIQDALKSFLGAVGPDPRVVSKWGPIYRKLEDFESRAAKPWIKTQSHSLGQP